MPAKLRMPLPPPIHCPAYPRLASTVYRTGLYFQATASPHIFVMAESVQCADLPWGSSSINVAQMELSLGSPTWIFAVHSGGPSNQFCYWRSEDCLVGLAYCECCVLWRLARCARPICNRKSINMGLYHQWFACICGKLTLT